MINVRFHCHYVKVQEARKVVQKKVEPIKMNLKMMLVKRTKVKMREQGEEPTRVVGLGLSLNFEFTFLARKSSFQEQ